MIMACSRFTETIPTIGFTPDLITVMTNTDPVGADTPASGGSYAKLHIGDYGEPPSARAKDVSHGSMGREMAELAHSLKFALGSLGEMVGDQVGLFAC